jgi:ATP-dependent Clp protease adaptor protein ClpS
LYQDLVIMTETDYSTKHSVLEELVEHKDLIVYNDDVNTFDHVIDSLISVCKHEIEQAEQCTYIIHYKGKCQAPSRPLKGAYFVQGVHLQ